MLTALLLGGRTSPLSAQRSVFHLNVVVAVRLIVACPFLKVETDDPLAEIAPALALLGPVMERFDNICDTYEPRGDGMADRCFIRYVGANYIGSIFGE